MDGVLVIDKPAGMTSHDVVDVVRRRLGTRKVGHAGTLDPDATGVLVVGVGRATRFLDYARAAPKRYIAGAVWGTATTTQDSSGEVTQRRPVDVTATDIRRVCGRFTGEIEQVPPMVSAVRVGGERLYRKARRGEEVERAARRVTVYALDLIDFSPPDRATFDVTCSAGTYVRTLIHDIGNSLGCGGHMGSLRRVETGGFTEADSVALDDVDGSHLRPVVEAVRVLPSLEVDDEDARAVAHGRPLDAATPVQGLVAVTNGGRLLGVYRAEGGSLRAERVVGS